MPIPQDDTGIKRCIGMTQYLDKFIKNISTRIENMRKLTRKYVPWKWTDKEDDELNDLKKAITTTSTLIYYDVNQDVLIPCDAYKCGLGSVLLQQGQPVAYASKALTETEIRYAQIDKEMLVIVFASNKFRQYIYGKPNIYIYINTDHRPLIRTVEKPLNDISSLLQKIRLRLQQYDITLSYIPGKDLVVVDALSRSYLEDKSYTDIIPEVISTVSLDITEEQKPNNIRNLKRLNM